MSVPDDQAPPLRKATREAVLTFWSAELGVNLGELLAPHVGMKLSDNPSLSGVFLFRRGDDVRIGASHDKLELLQAKLNGTLLSDVSTAKFWHSKLPSITGTVTGPASLFYLDAVPSGWAPAPDSKSLILVRGLAASDVKTLDELTATLTQSEREISGVDGDSRTKWGVFVKGQLIATAGYDAWPNRIAHIGVAVHPEFRGRKFGQLAVQAAVRGAAMRKRIAQFYTLNENAAAAGLARALHFIAFASTLYVRPRDEA